MPGLAPGNQPKPPFPAWKDIDLGEVGGFPATRYDVLKIG
jgi:hypothetical protein